MNYEDRIDCRNDKKEELQSKYFGYDVVYLENCSKTPYIKYKKGFLNKIFKRKQYTIDVTNVKWDKYKADYVVTVSHIFYGKVGEREIHYIYYLYVDEEYNTVFFRD